MSSSLLLAGALPLKIEGESQVAESAIFESKSMRDGVGGSGTAVCEPGYESLGLEDVSHCNEAA
jgi:hypothetical protein